MKIKNLDLTKRSKISDSWTFKLVIMLTLVLLWGCYIFRNSFNSLQLTVESTDQISKNALKSKKYADSVVKISEKDNSSITNTQTTIAHQYSDLIDEIILKQAEAKKIKQYFGNVFYNKIQNNNLNPNNVVKPIRSSIALSELNKNKDLHVIAITRFKVKLRKKVSQQVVYIDINYNLHKKQGRVVDSRLLEV